MTRYEILQRFASDERTHRNHTFTFHVLTEMWLDYGKPELFTPDFEEVLRLLRTSRRNLFRWIADLETFGFIGYQRGKNQHEKSVVSFIGSVQYGTANQVGSAQGGTADSLVVSNMAQHEQSASVQHGTATNLLVSRMAQQNSGSVQNNTAESNPVRQKHGFAELSTSAETVLVHNNNHLIKELIINSKGEVLGDDNVKGVQGKKQKSAKRETRPVCKFADSPLADLAKFKEAFASETTYQAADLNHYYERLLNWRDKSGHPPERADWLATAKTFLLNDYREGKLVTVTNLKPTHNAKSNKNSRSAVIEPESTTGRRFGSW